MSSRPKKSGAKRGSVTPSGRKGTEAGHDSATPKHGPLHDPTANNPEPQGLVVVGGQAVAGPTRSDLAKAPCPLYADAREQIQKRGDEKHGPRSTKHQFAHMHADGNDGLRFDKVCNTWKPDWKGLKDAGGEKLGGKAEWIASFAGTVGTQALLEDYGKRRQAFLLAQGKRAWGGTFTTDWRFVTGLGRNHPVENGFAWHHTLGVPYLPGSSVKGMLRAWCRDWLDEDRPDLFGDGPTPTDPDAGRVGGVVFLDALPTRPVKLRADVMTPHYQPYHTGRPETAPIPGDWFSPNPIPFLTVAPGQAFHFAVLARTGAAAGDLVWVRDRLIEALEWIGAGAKTATGYGRFVAAPSGDQP